MFPWHFEKHNFILPSLCASCGCLTQPILVQIPPPLPGSPLNLASDAKRQRKHCGYTSTQMAQSFSSSLTLSCNSARVHRKDTSPSCTLWILCKYEREHISERGHSHSECRNYCSRSYDVSQQEEEVWALAVNIHEDPHLALRQH